MQLAVRFVGLAARLLLALGLGCLLLGGYLAWQSQSFASTAVRTTGTVVSYHETSHEGLTRYRPRVRYTTLRGDINTAAGQMDYTSPRIPVGTEVPVHYQERIHGVTKMTRVVSNGLRMLGICWHAWFRLGG